MSEFREQIEEMEVKGRRSRVIYAVAFILALLFFAWLFFSSTLNAEVANEQTAIATKWKTKHHADSIKKKEINEETVQVQKILDSIKKSSSDEKVAVLIKDLEEKIGHIESYSTDSTIVRYFVRKDSTAVENSISTLKHHNFKLVNKETSYETDKFSNHLFYGSKVDMKRVEILKKELQKNGAQIERVVPFFMGYKWKDESIEIGYEEYNEKELEENAKYQVQIHLVAKKNAEEEVVEKKEQIRNLLNFKAFVPIDKPILNQWDVPNFPQKTTIKYFSEEPAVLSNAQEIGDLLTKYFKTEVVLEKSENPAFTEKQNKSILSLYYAANAIATY